MPMCLQLCLDMQSMKLESASSSPSECIRLTCRLFKVAIMQASQLRYPTGSSISSFTALARHADLTNHMLQQCSPGLYLGTGLAMPVWIRVVAMSMYVSAGSWSLMPNSFCTCTPNPQHNNEINNCSSMESLDMLQIRSCSRHVPSATEKYFQGQCSGTIVLT